MVEQIWKLAAVYQEHNQKCLTEEEKAEKEIEHSYLMLHIHWNDSDPNR